MAEVRWTRRSLNHLNEIRLYLTVESPENMSAVVQRIEDMADRLVDFPRLGRIVPLPGRRDVRQIMVGNYRLNYHLGTEDEVLIVSVRHGARLSDLDEFEE